MSARKPTICQLLFSLDVGGAEVLAAALARRLAHAYTFSFVCLGELGTLGEQLRGEGFAVHSLEKRPGVDCRCVLRLARLLRREQIDLLHAHQYPGFFYGIAARLLCRRPPLLFTEHGRHHPDHPRRKRMILNRMLLERRDVVVAVGAAVRQALVDNEGFPAKRVRIIYNGVPLRVVPEPGLVRLEVRRELGLASTDLVLLFVARLDSVKDHATAIRAFRQVLQRRDDVRLVIVGDGPERPAIEALVRDHGLAGRVHLLGLRRDVPRLLAAGDGLLLTSVSEGIPLSVIEAMGAGLPVVATSVGGLPEVVSDGVTGLLAPAGDDVRLADRILTLCADPARARHMGEQGRARALQHFSDEGMHAAYDSLYREMLAGKKAARRGRSARDCRC